MFAYTRRAVLAWVGAAPLLVSCSREDADQQDLESFMQLSSVLTGFTTQELDRELAKWLLVRLVDQGFANQLEEADPENLVDVDSELVVEIIEAWYSGIHKVRDSSVVATFTEAKIWDAVEFAAIPTVCKGQLGSWSEPGVVSRIVESQSRSNS